MDTKKIFYTNGCDLFKITYKEDISEILEELKKVQGLTWIEEEALKGHVESETTPLQNGAILHHYQLKKLND